MCSIVIFIFVIVVSGESRSVQVKLSGDKTYYLAKELEENVRYVFSVKAKTAVAWGPARVGNVTIGPQPGNYRIIVAEPSWLHYNSLLILFLYDVYNDVVPVLGSPGEPSQPLLITLDNSVKMTWSNGAPGDSPINGYIIQGIEKQGGLPVQHLLL